MTTMSALPSVKDAVLSVSQETLLHALERRVQLHVQAERTAALLPDATEETTSLPVFLKQHVHRLSTVSTASTTAFARQVDACVDDWNALYAHAHQSFALVEEMESSHGQVVSKTQALYDSFETILQQVEALNMRVELIAAPMPHFLAIDGIAQTLGFGVQFAAPSSATGDAHRVQQPVQVFQHKRSIDPTTKAFQQALEKIDVAVMFLEAHKEFKDAACYIEAYRTLTAGAIQCLKDYAVSGLDAARDVVLEAIAKTSQDNTLPNPGQNLDETSPYYVHFQLVVPALNAVTQQLERLARSKAEAANASTYMTNVMALADVLNAYASQRVQLLTPVLSMYFESLSHGTDIVNLLRLSGTYMVRLCEAEFRLFLNMFGREPRDAMFIFKSGTQTDEEDDEEDEEATAFERLIFQLSGVLYSIVRPQMLVQKDLEVLCEIIQVLQSELIEFLITPRAHVVGFVEPVMHRMIQDAQERLILCVQKYIRDEIEGFSPSPSDLDYPNKLIAAANDESTANSLYATWYPTLEHTLLCLSKIYHFVNMEIFEELAQDAIQICTASLKMASADITALKGPMHGSLFLVKHLLTLREQITPFDIKFSVRAKALDFTSSADAMAHLLSDVSAVFSLSLQDNALVGLFTQGIPQIQETTSDVKKDLELELRKSCTGFIDAVLDRLAQPLLLLMKQISDVQHRASATAPADLRKHAFTRPENVSKTLDFVSKQLNDVLPEILETIRLYLRNASTETILFKPIQRNLLDAVENLQTLLQQSYSAEERQSYHAAFQLLLQQLRAI
ncbi:hypothetical protein Poli38472_012014 [Pythium oligandrum]|uniref:Conserved oligomeric Golgi complex subunit 3 n=1 Tax=Pythium oligandrum TaxID=41045 RepID=A0A8K1FQT1_PYTOL|nr:hypothetical protein Poli38472_012014 [Pythium oligandrum]|eukprot:TMW66898.1 hypothetical protein Poli38472_012014 [Pythium oligandrum]